MIRKMINSKVEFDVFKNCVSNDKNYFSWLLFTLFEKGKILPAINICEFNHPIPFASEQILFSTMFYLFIYPILLCFFLLFTQTLHSSLSLSFVFLDSLYFLIKIHQIFELCRKVFLENLLCERNKLSLITSVISSRFLS